MTNYQLAKIYKIVGNGVYVGSTCEPTLAKRLTKHVANCKSYLNGKGNKNTSFDVLQGGDYYIELVEAYPCNSKDELLARERYWSGQIECVNKIKNQGLYLELGAKEYKKQYFQQHKKTLKQYRQLYITEHKIQIRTQQQQYDQLNREKISQRKRKYYQANQEIISLRRVQKYRRNKLYGIIRNGLDIINQLDDYFENKI